MVMVAEGQTPGVSAALMGTGSWLLGEAAPAFRQVSRPPPGLQPQRKPKGTSADVHTRVEMSPSQLFYTVHWRLT